MAFFETIEAMPSAVGAPVGRGAAIGGAAGRGAAPGAPIGAGAGRIGGIAPGEAAGRIPAGGVGIGTRAAPPCCINKGRLYKFILIPILRPLERLVRQCRSRLLGQDRFAVVR